MLDARSQIKAVAGEVRRHRSAYIILVCFVVAGPFVTHFMFPKAPALAGLFGGILFGVYACFCAVPEQFLDGSGGGDD